MAVERLVKEIKKLSPGQRQELFRRLGITFPPEAEKRGGPSDPFSRLLGKVDGPGTGSKRYKEDLYGGEKPL